MKLEEQLLYSLNTHISGYHKYNFEDGLDLDDYCDSRVDEFTKLYVYSFYYGDYEGALMSLEEYIKHDCS